MSPPPIALTLPSPPPYVGSPTALFCPVLSSSLLYGGPPGGGTLQGSSQYWMSSPRSLIQTRGSPEQPPY